MPESVGMNGQIDWQAQQIPHLVCSLAGQRCSEAWGTFSTRTGKSITALIAWRKEEWRKDIPPSKVENDLCSTRQILALFRGQPWGDCWETGRSAYGPLRALWCHLELKLKLKLSLDLMVAVFYRSVTLQFLKLQNICRFCTILQVRVSLALFDLVLGWCLCFLCRSVQRICPQSSRVCVCVCVCVCAHARTCVRVLWGLGWCEWLTFNPQGHTVCNNNNNERISRAPFHGKHAQLRWTGANTKIQSTCV